MSRPTMTHIEKLTRNPLWRALKSKPMPSRTQLDLKISAAAALVDVMHGRGTHHDLDTLACACNVAMVLCERGFGPEQIDVIRAAQEGLMRSRARASIGKSIGLDGPAVPALQQATDILGQQIEAAGQSTVTDALNEVLRRLRAGKTLEISNG